LQINGTAQVVVACLSVTANYGGYTMEIWNTSAYGWPFTASNLVNVPPNNTLTAYGSQVAAAIAAGP
jgi:hypothetical protein